MSILADVIERLRSIVFRRRDERELEEELALHTTMEAEQLERAGLSASEARRQSRMTLGGVEQVKEDVRDARGTRLFHDISRDFGFALRTPYSAAKWAVVGFTQSLAVEAGPDKVRVNCIQPGIVEGDRIERVVAAKAKELRVSPEEVRTRMLAGTSLNTTVTAQDIANMALYLATEPGRHISGQDIAVCGGARYLV